MAITNTIPDSYQHKYDNLWTHLLQQKANRLRNFVTVKPNCSGKMVHFDQLGLLGFDEKTSRDIARAVTPIDTPTSKRSLVPRYYHKAYGFEEFDASQLADQSVPITETVQAFGFAAGRQMEQLIVGVPGSDWGMLGNAYGGDNGTDSISYDANQTIAHGTTGMSMAKLREALQKLMESEAWGQDSETGGDVACVAMTARQIKELLADDELTTTDRKDLRNILSSQNGFADIYGMRIIRTQQLPVDTNIRSCPFWVKSCVNFGIWVDHRVRLAIRDDLEETIQLRAKFGANAVRMQEGGVGIIQCSEA